MKNLIKVSGKYLCLFSLILFFISCNTSDKKTVKNTPITDTVVIKQMQFFPAELHVKTGDTVVWINNDIVDHNVTEEKTKSFYSDTIAVGKSWKMVIKDSAGYYCSIHPTMKGQLVLK
jgi:plastocyanin